MVIFVSCSECYKLWNCFPQGGRFNSCLGPWYLSRHFDLIFWDQMIEESTSEDLLRLYVFTLFHGIQEIFWADRRDYFVRFKCVYKMFISKFNFKFYIYIRILLVLTCVALTTFLSRQSSCCNVVVNVDKWRYVITLRWMTYVAK